MSFPRYPKYKDSGVEWLGEVPEHWDSLKLKHYVQAHRAITYGIVQCGPNVPDGIPYIRPADMTDEHGISNPLDILRTSSDIAESYRRSTIHTGDLVCSIGPSFGKVMITPPWLDGGNLTQGTARIAVSEENHSRFVFWALRSPNTVAQWDTAVGGATFRALNLGPLAETVVPRPPLPEQQAIAAFLDRETAKIDALIAEQRRLIELLKEKRQAVISHAVTKGLNPDVPMKDSGIEWLGEVPEHWEVMPIRYAARLESGHTPSRSRPDWWTDCTTPWISLSDIWQVRYGNILYITDTKEKVSQLGLDNSAARLLPKGTVILSRTASVGFSVIMGTDMATTQDFANWVPRSNLLPEYLLFTFRSMGDEFERLKYGSTHNTIYMPDIAAMRFVLPPMSEQKSIVEYILQETTKLDTLTTQAEQSITLLQERRSALISAAVTGRIDVRGVAGRGDAA